MQKQLQESWEYTAPGVHKAAGKWRGALGALAGRRAEAGTRVISIKDIASSAVGPGGGAKDHRHIPQSSIRSSITLALLTAKLRGIFRRRVAGPPEARRPE